MKVKTTLLFILFTFALNFICAITRPNILYLYVDDLGWGSIGPNGQYERKEKGLPYVLTPNLDKLAEEGINFTRGYGCTVCSPARSSQQTGFHQGYTFADRNDPDNAKKAIRAEDITMGDALSRAGYATGYWGKWGYGGSKDMENPTIDNIQTLPTSHGYKFVVAELHHVRAHTFFQPTLWNAPSQGWTPGFMELKPNSVEQYRNNAYPNYPAFQNHPKYPNPAYCDDVYAFACLDFVRNQALEYNRSGKPFFGLFAAQIPHAPFNEVQKLPNWDYDYKDKSFFDELSAQSKQWCAMVTRIDAHFGNILNALKDPNGDGDNSDSVADHTLVVFQSDNGGPRGSNREQLYSNGGLQGSKGSIYEGGIRVPTIMRWPAAITSDSKLKAGTSTDMVLDCSDLLPTFCELAETKIPVGLSGVSIAPTLSGKGKQKTRHFLIHETNSQASIIRGNWKLIRSKKALNSTTKKKNSKKKNASGNFFQLYDLKKDHAEQNNLASTKSELVKELNTLLTEEMVDEPAGFANTYHDWKVKTKNGALHVAANWTDYIYENAEITYMEESGGPLSHWTAKIPQNGSAVANKKTEFLSLELKGRLSLKPGSTVVARNELRVTEGGELKMDGGTVESERWLENEKGGIISGHGKIKSELYNSGVMKLSPEKPLIVNGVVHLSGKLELDDSKHPFKEKKISVIQGKSISGKFENSYLQIQEKTYAIQYEKKEVYLVAK